MGNDTGLLTNSGALTRTASLLGFGFRGCQDLASEADKLYTP